MRTRDRRHRVGIPHEVIRTTEGGAASDEKSLIPIQVPAHRAVILASVSSALTSDYRCRNRRIGADHDPCIYAVPNWLGRSELDLANHCSSHEAGRPSARAPGYVRRATLHEVQYQYGRSAVPENSRGSRQTSQFGVPNCSRPGHRLAYIPRDVGVFANMSGNHTTGDKMDRFDNTRTELGAISATKQSMLARTNFTPAMPDVDLGFDMIAFGHDPFVAYPIQVKGTTDGLKIWEQYVRQPIIMSYVLHPVSPSPQVFLMSGVEAWALPEIYIERGGKASDFNALTLNDYRFPAVTVLLRDILEEKYPDTTENWNRLIDMVDAERNALTVE